MMHADGLLSYSLLVAGFVLIPGPATILTVARATTSGAKVGIATGAGIAAGDIVHTMLAAVGVSALIAACATLFTVVKYLGAAYLVYLGMRELFKKAPAGLEADRLAVTAAQAFQQAVLAEVLNPKTALFFLAFLPQFAAPENGHVAAQLASLGTLFALIGFVSTIIYSLVAGRLGTFLRRNPLVLKWQGRVVGSIYVALGTRLALQER